MTAMMYVTVGKKEQWKIVDPLGITERCHYCDEYMQLAKIELIDTTVQVTYTCPYCHSSKIVNYLKVGERSTF